MAINNDFVFVNGTIKRETDRAVFLDNGEWYPKSQIKEIKPNGILVKKWVVEKKSIAAKPKLDSSESAPTSTPTPTPTSNSGSEFNEDNLIECRIKLETPNATLVIVKGTGKEVWFPKSTIKKAFDGDVFVGIVPKTWMYKKKLESGDIEPNHEDPVNNDSDPSEFEDDNALEERFS